ncbi:MAG: stage III sporulation protein AD [Oscillospiraceae bacterium]|jgi:stage III sporulation protein AD|nr:stage III sporulation protein AD [Oscillospiraceae bacterium]
MNILAIIGVGLIAAILCVMLRQVRPEFALILSLAAGVFILFALFSDTVDIIDRIRALIDSAGVPSAYAAVLVKALGICFVTQIACDTCKDAGESAISAKIEMAGKIAVLVVSLPLFEQVLNVVYGLISAA